MDRSIDFQAIDTDVANSATVFSHLTVNQQGLEPSSQSMPVREVTPTMSIELTD